MLKNELPQGIDYGEKRWNQWGRRTPNLSLNNKMLLTYVREPVALMLLRELRKPNGQKAFQLIWNQNCLNRL